MFLYSCMCACSIIALYPYRSGTEEEYTTLHQLLEDISQFMKDLAFLKENQKASKKKVDKEKKRERQ